MTSFIGDAIKLEPEMKHKLLPSLNKNHSSNGWMDKYNRYRNQHMMDTRSVYTMDVYEFQRHETLTFTTNMGVR